MRSKTKNRQTQLYMYTDACERSSRLCLKHENSENIEKRKICSLIRIAINFRDDQATKRSHHRPELVSKTNLRRPETELIILIISNNVLLLDRWWTFMMSYLSLHIRDHLWFNDDFERIFLNFIHRKQYAHDKGLQLSRSAVFSCKRRFFDKIHRSYIAVARDNNRDGRFVNRQDPLPSRKDFSLFVVVLVALGKILCCFRRALWWTHRYSMGLVTCTGA